MKYRYAFVFFFIGFLLQSTVMVHFSVFGITPNLVLCLVILFSFLYEGNQGFTLGILFGLLQDMCFAIVLGPTAITYFIVAILMGEIRHYLYRDNVLTIFFAAVIGTSVYYILNWGIVTVFGGTYRFLYVMKELPILLVYHFILMVIFYLLVGRRAIRHPQDRYYKGNKLYYE